MRSRFTYLVYAMVEFAWRIVGLLRNIDLATRVSVLDGYMLGMFIAGREMCMASVRYLCREESEKVLSDRLTMCRHSLHCMTHKQDFPIGTMALIVTCQCCHSITDC
jgi:hypothetical protein